MAAATAAYAAAQPQSLCHNGFVLDIGVKENACARYTLLAQWHCGSKRIMNGGAPAQCRARQQWDRARDAWGCERIYR